MPEGLLAQKDMDHFSLMEFLAIILNDDRPPWKAELISGGFLGVSTESKPQAGQH